MKDKTALETGRSLPLMEEFYSIQGEGYHTGKAAYFIRLGGCDVGCKWCDVKESWDPKKHPIRSVDSIIEKILSYPAKSVVVTGGEPLLHPMDYLCEKLHENHIENFLETCGNHPLSGKWDWICLSPKKKGTSLDGIFSMANELKQVIHSVEDFEWAEENAKKVNSKCKLYLQPEWGNINNILPEIIQYVKKNTKWNISLQTHKYMHIP
jgi:7-carboxy-7-deazaguanine synthase